MLFLLLALFLSLAGVLLLGPKVIPLLKKLKFGQTIYELGPQTHQKKQGTPTMGGLMFALTVTVLGILLPLLWNSACALSLGVVGFALLNMLIGFVDDYIKVVKKRNLGLIWWQKIIGQVLACAGFSVYCYFCPSIGSSLVVPFANVEWDLGIFYIPVMTCVLIFVVNSANLQDGMDGLLSTVTLVNSSALALIALLFPALCGTLVIASQEAYRNVAVVALALTGSMVGFLRFNRYPAKVFMGDTGSMFIGGAITAMAVVLRLPILIIFLCVTWLASSFSVILQRFYFKVTHGKRIFKMSPIHHHFELSGMTEPQVVSMYAAVTLLACLAAVLSLIQ